MDPKSDGCRLCLDPFADRFTTIDSPELKGQLEKVFCFSIEPKQGYWSGVCHSCSNTVSDFYKFSENVRQNQEVLEGLVLHCDPTMHSKASIESVRVESCSNSGFPKTTEKDEFSGEVPTLTSKITLESIKVEAVSEPVLLEPIEEACESIDAALEEVLNSSVDESFDPTIDSIITFESIKVETHSDSELTETMADACDPIYEVSGGEEVPTVDSNVTFESFKVEPLCDPVLLKAKQDACESKDEVSGEDVPNFRYAELIKSPSKKSQPEKRRLHGLDTDESTKQSKHINLKRQQEQDRFFKKHIPMICDLCGTSTANFTELCSHFREQHNVQYGYVVCCKKRLFQRAGIQDHIDFHTNPDVFRCKVCGNKYRNKTSLNSHMLSMHSKGGPLKCEHCPQSFARKSALAQHMQQHVKVECLKCKKLFASNKCLSYHMRNVHKDRSVVCDICSKKFQNKRSFDCHMKEHMGIEAERFQCGICQRWFKCKHTLEYHINCVHNDGSREFQCDICLQKYPHPRALFRHKTIIHAEPKYACEFCGKKFKTPYCLKEHRNTHTGEVLYTCKFCGKLNNCKKALYQHIRRKHPTEYAQDKLMGTNNDCNS